MTVRVIDDGLTPVMNEVNYMTMFPLTYGWRSDRSIEQGHWNHVFAGYDRHNREGVELELPEEVKRIWQHIETNYLQDHVLMRAYLNGHTYGTEGYPHTDSDFPEDRTTIIYIVQRWQKNWAGETVVFEGEDITHSVMPKPMRMMIFPGHKWHAARGVTRICPVLRLCLVFKSRPK